MNFFLFSNIIGTAKSKQFAKNIAASHMLKILSDSSQDQVNPQLQQQWWFDVSFFHYSSKYQTKCEKRMHIFTSKFSKPIFLLISTRIVQLLSTVKLNALIFWDCRPFRFVENNLSSFVIPAHFGYKNYTEVGLCRHDIGYLDSLYQ